MVLNVFFHNFYNSLMPNGILEKKHGCHIIVKLIYIKSKIYLSKRFFYQNKLQKVLNILYSIWKKTFNPIHQLSCFVGHPVDKGENINNWKDIKQSKKLERGQLNCEQRSKQIMFAKLKKCQCLFIKFIKSINIYINIYTG